jgi:hypothetical protein
MPFRVVNGERVFVEATDEECDGVMELLHQFITSKEGGQQLKAIVDKQLLPAPEGRNGGEPANPAAADQIVDAAAQVSAGPAPIESCAQDGAESTATRGMETRYQACATGNEHRSHRRVQFCLLRYDPDEDKISGENFSQAEIEMLRTQFATMDGFTFSSRVDDNPDFESRWIFSTYQGLCRFYERADWLIPLPVVGYYDLRHAESGPMVDDPNAGRIVFRVGEGGKVELEEPRF